MLSLPRLVARQGFGWAAMAPSYTLTYSRAEASQEKSCFMPFCWIFFHSLGLRKKSSARRTAANRLDALYAVNLKPSPPGCAVSVTVSWSPPVARTIGGVPYRRLYI